jgi:hypothetical protein
MQNKNRTDTTFDPETKPFSLYINEEEILADSEQDVVKIIINLRGDSEDNMPGQVKGAILEYGKPLYYWEANPTPDTFRFEDNPNNPYKRISCRPPYREIWERLDDSSYQDALRRVGRASHSLFSGTTCHTLYAREVRRVTLTDIEKEILNIFQSGEGDIFEDGMESNFSRSISSFVQRHGKSAISEIGHIVRHGLFNDDVISEALRCLARLDDSRTHNYRRWLLEKTLESESFYMRDAAASGLSFMDDERSIVALEKAMAREKNKELRDDMADVLEQFRG